MTKMKSPYVGLMSSYFPHDPVFADVDADGVLTTGVSMTRQEFADECDINVLMAKYERTGVWPLPPNDGVPQYLDVADVPDLITAMDILKRGEQAFMSLPAKVRREFENDPVNFVSFAGDPANLEQMREWGLAPPAPPSEKVSEVLGRQPEPPIVPASGGVAKAD